MKLILSCLLFSVSSFASYYPNDYLESREYFLKQVEKYQRLIPAAEHIQLTVPTKTKAHLTIDLLYLPQKSSQPKNLLILTSGIHGVEAFTGSAIQFDFFNTDLITKHINSMGLLIVHAVNPYGYFFKRRVTENNIDLNRNIAGDNKLFNKTSQSYSNFENFLNPAHPLQAGFWSDAKLFFKSLIKLFRYGRKQMAQIAVGGQYQNSKGMYFGGKRLEPHAELLRKEFLKYGRDYANILHIDLHTGYGERGRLHFLSSKQASLLPGFNKIFKGFEIDLGEDKDFYETSGSFDAFTIQIFPNKSKVIPITFEFGTMDSQTTMGGFHSLKNMIYENQGHHYGYTNDDSKNRALKDFYNMFNPKDQTWRKTVLKTAHDTLETVVTRFAELK